MQRVQCKQKEGYSLPIMGTRSYRQRKRSCKLRNLSVMLTETSGTSVAEPSGLPPRCHVFLPCPGGLSSISAPTLCQCFGDEAPCGTRTGEARLLSGTRDGFPCDRQDADVRPRSTAVEHWLASRPGGVNVRQEW